MKRKILFGILLITVIVGMFVYAYRTKPKDIASSVVSIDVGDLAPDAELRDVTGKIHRLNEYKGKVVLINFWATWCPPCVIEMPSLVSVHNKLEPQGLEILAVNLDESEKGVKEFIDVHHLPFTVFLDPAGQFAQTFLVYGLPYTVILDREGKIRHKIFGGHEWDQGNMFEKIKSLL